MENTLLAESQFMVNSDINIVLNYYFKEIVLVIKLKIVWSISNQKLNCPKIM